jgi:general secretion pathway protein K
LFFLAALSLAIGAHVSAGLRLAGEARKRAVAVYAARAGVRRAIAVAAADTNAWDAGSESWSGESDAFRELEIGDGVCSIWHTDVVASGAVTTNDGLADEERRINVNRATPELLSALFEKIGETDSATAQSLAAAVTDWRDGDDEPQAEGAESAYYRGLQPPYECRNDLLESVAELRLVKGMTDECFARIHPFVTVYGQGTVNFNTAGEAVLGCVASACGGPDTLSRLLAGKIVDFQRSGHIFQVANATDMQRRLSAFASLLPEEESLFRKMTKFATIQGSCFRGVAAGSVGGRATFDRFVEFVFDRASRSPLYWREF